jgi:N-acetylmuramoyl-L-alanine amidase
MLHLTSSRFLRAIAFAAVAAASAFLLAATSPAWSEAPAIAAAIDVAADGGRTRFTIALSRAVTPRVAYMERPDRVIVELPELTFRLPAEIGRRREGLVSSFRYGLFGPERSRIVIDLAQPASVSRLDVEEDHAHGTAKLIVELARTEREAFRHAVAESASILQPPALETPAAAAPEDRRPVIMLDPGHGGVDPGATASAGMFEKEIVFSFAQKLKKKLEVSGRYRVLMTRNRDVFIPLGDRVRLARSARADLFVSIHADSISGGPEVRGLTVYTGSERASDADSARLADRENRADTAAGVESSDNVGEEVADILQDLTSRETRIFSHRVAKRLVQELDAVARLNKNPHREAGFRVLRAHDVPSVLVELGYLSSRKDFDLLISDEWRDRSTDAMTSAIDLFFAPRFAQGGTAAVSP